MSSRLRAPDSLDTRICTGRVFTPKRSMSSVNIAFGDTPQPSSFCVRGLSKNSGANRPLDRINSSADSPKMHTLMTVAPSARYVLLGVVKIPRLCAEQSVAQSRLPRIEQTYSANHAPWHPLPPATINKTPGLPRAKKICTSVLTLLSAHNQGILTSFSEPYIL